MRTFLVWGVVFFAAIPICALGAPLDPIGTGPLVVQLNPVANGLGQLTDLAHVPGDNARLFVTTLNGTVRLVKNGVVQSTPVLDTTATTNIVLGSTGMMGLAFHPQFGLNTSPGYQKFYVTTSEAPGTAQADFTAANPYHQEVLYEYILSGDVALPASRRELLRVDNPGFEHNMNDLAFGPDGMLYVTIGDGGNSAALAPNAQSLSSIRGKVLRIDPLGNNSANGKYGLPGGAVAANPFVNTLGAVKEVYAYGFRNPYRLTFDRANGDLYVGDVGQSSIEEVDKVVSGGNYGWNQKEGSFIFNPNYTLGANSPGSPVGLIDPIFQYDHAEGVAVIGGHVYRGSLMPQLQGKYVFGDWAAFNSGQLYYADPADGIIHEFQFFEAPSGNQWLQGIAEDSTGELFLITGNGNVLALVPEPSALALLVAMTTLTLRRPARTRHQRPPQRGTN